MKPPFCPFRQGDQWYALYAKDYTASRIMKLPSCEDVWGEERDTFGFCPVEFFVPAIQEMKFGGDRSGTFDNDFEDFLIPGLDSEYDWTYLEPEYMQYGFVSGCVWGDDSSWKVQYFDLSRLSEGIVLYDTRLGYVELTDKSLKESIKNPRRMDFL